MKYFVVDCNSSAPSGLNLTRHGFCLWPFNGFEQFLWNFFLYCLLAKGDGLEKEKRNVSLLVIVTEESDSLLMLMPG